MSQIAATHDERGWAVCLDVDGTILEIAETPQKVCVPETLKRLLNELCMRLDGALALVSGRNVYAYVNRCGGVSIRVGRPIATFATYWLQDVGETAAWLHSIPPLATAHLRPAVKRNSA